MAGLRSRGVDSMGRTCQSNSLCPPSLLPRPMCSFRLPPLTWRQCPIADRPPPHRKRGFRRE
eukprot:7295488-Lingulodinium_polyedra.AAC.1